MTSQKLVIGISAVISLAVVVAVFVYTGNRVDISIDSREVNEPSIEVVNNSPGQTVKEETAPNSSDNKIEVDEVVDNFDFEEYLDEVGVSEESISKLWFDVRQEESTEEDLYELIEQIKTFLDSGKIPMIVEKFPLLLVDVDSYGFQHNILWTPEYPINLITMVAPSKFDMENRVVTFLMSDNGKSISSFVRADLKVIPSSFGRAEEDGSLYYVVGGELLDEVLFETTSPIGLFAVEVVDGSVGLVEIEQQDITIENSELVYEDYLMMFRSNTSFPVFFYNEYENEGQSTEELFLVTSDDINSHLYKVGILEGRVVVTLEEINGR